MTLQEFIAFLNEHFAVEEAKIKILHVMLEDGRHVFVKDDKATIKE